MANEQDHEMFKTIFTYGDSALKSVILINGGAAVALLAFIGNIVARGSQRSIAAAYSLPLACYTLGVLAGSLATGGAYLTQYSYVHFGQKVGVFWHWITALFVMAAYVIFGTATFFCYEAIQHTT